MLPPPSTSPGGAGAGKPGEQHLCSEEDLLLAASGTQPLRLSFVLRLSEVAVGFWETVLWQRRMYIQVPTCLPPEGSKEGFVRLLEYAEDVLNCEQIIVCFCKDRADRALLVRTFMFLGFAALHPGHPLTPSNADASQLFMLYNVQ